MAIRNPYVHTVHIHMEIPYGFSISMRLMDRKPARNYDSHFCSPVLDWTIRSGPNFLKTRLDCGLGVPDRTVWSFLQFLFPSDKKDRTAVWGCRTVRSGLFQRSTKKATVQTGPDRGQSITLQCSCDSGM